MTMPMGVVERITRARETGDFAALAEAVPYARFLGLAVEISERELVCRMPFAPHLVGNASLPALHGGTLGALLESAAIFGILWESEALVLPKTITLTVDYLRSGRPVDTRARGTITRQGRRVASVHVEAWQEDRARPIATANVHLLLAPVPSGT